MTQKEFWIKEVNSLIYEIGCVFPREHYQQHIVPKQSIKTLQTFYTEHQRIYMLYKFRYLNANNDLIKIRELHKKEYKDRIKLIRKILKG